MTPEEKITCNLSLKSMHLSELASAIGCSEMKTARLLREMRQADEVRDMGYGRYELIPDYPKGAA